MAEKDFQAEIAASISQLNTGLYYKLPDPPVSQFGERSRKWAAAGRKPFDCFWALPCGLFLPMELKQVKGLSINCGEKGKIRPHQEEAGCHLRLLGYPATLLVNFQHVYPPKKAAALGVGKVNRVFACLMSDVVEWRSSDLLTDTIPMDYFASHGLELARVGKGWDVRALWSWALQQALKGSFA